MRRRRGFLYAVVLLLATLLLTLALGMVAKRSHEYASSRWLIQEQQALELALAGIEDARVKLNFSQYFPPPFEEGQERFSYVEFLNDLDGNPLGSYQVTVDQHWLRPPYSVLRVESLGRLGSEQNPRCQRRLLAEFDMASERGGAANPDYFRIIRWQDGLGY